MSLSMHRRTNPIKVKLNGYYLNVLINGLFQHRDCYGDISDFLFRLVNENEKMKSNRKKRFVFQPDEIKIIRSCLLDWRNEQIRAEKETAVEVINELIVKFI